MYRHASYSNRQRVVTRKNETHKRSNSRLVSNLLRECMYASADSTPNATCVTCSLSGKHDIPQTQNDRIKKSQIRQQRCEIRRRVRLEPVIDAALREVGYLDVEMRTVDKRRRRLCSERAREAERIKKRNEVSVDDVYTNDA